MLEFYFYQGGRGVWKNGNGSIIGTIYLMGIKRCRSETQKKTLLCITQRLLSYCMNRAIVTPVFFIMIWKCKCPQEDRAEMGGNGETQNPIVITRPSSHPQFHPLLSLLPPHHRPLRWRPHHPSGICTSGTSTQTGSSLWKSDARRDNIFVAFSGALQASLYTFFFKQLFS